ncbi:MAG: hypothetical protein A3K61_00435 [Thaumarchaeota archaeon RBG_16_49_8]|nr:MAG: hypothetical protein A3K61_00435 [Thaumarchaeota archaeon RBG_16_49_8]
MDSQNKQLFRQMSKIGSALSNADAIEIFVQVGRGMKGGQEALEELGMSKKRYYTRLRELVKCGLVEKDGAQYRYTVLGSLFEQQFVGLLQIVEREKELQMIEELRKSGRFTEEEIGGFVRKIIFDSPERIGEGSWVIPRLALSYEEMVKSIVERLSTARKSIYLASRFTEDRIISAILSKAQAGATVKVLADSKLLKNYVNETKGKLEMTDSHASERVKVAVNPFYPYKVERKFCQLPFSFILMDGRGVGIELVDAQHPDKFTGAVFIENETLFNYMKATFDSLWEGKTEHAIPEAPSTRPKTNLKWRSG